MKNTYTTVNNMEIVYRESNEGGAMPSLHTHGHYEIYYLNKGERTYIIDNKVYDMSKGSVALIPPNIFHKTSGGVFGRTLVSFSAKCLEDFFNENVIPELLSCFSNTVISFDEREQRVVEDILISMEKDEDKCDYDKRPLLLANLLTIFNTHTEKDKRPVKIASNNLISQILDYVSENYLNIKNLDEIAQEFFVTKYHLCRIFKENTGMSIFSYINLMKLQLSCELLVTTNRSITDISIECGFNSHAYFCKSFNKQFNISPMTFRKNNSTTVFV